VCGRPGTPAMLNPVSEKVSYALMLKMSGNLFHENKTTEHSDS